MDCHTHGAAGLTQRKGNKILQLSRLNKRADYGYEAGATTDLTTGEVFTASDGEEGFTACVGDNDGGSGGDTQREIIFYTQPSLNRPGKQGLQSVGEITKRG